MERHGGLIVVVLIAVLLAACGPQMATPTVKVPEPTGEASAVPATSGGVDTPTVEVSPSGDLPVDPDDWHALGAPDAPVTIIEYSDFQ